MACAIAKQKEYCNAWVEISLLYILIVCEYIYSNEILNGIMQICTIHQLKLKKVNTNNNAHILISHAPVWT
jgi:hypothetical protein